MKDKILYILLGLLFVNALFSWWQKSDNTPDYEFLRTQHTRIRNEIRELQTIIIQYDEDIFRIKREMVKTDSNILHADAKQLDSLFTVFFGRLN